MYDHEWFLNRLKERRPEMYEEYEFIEEYTKSREPLKAKHLKCGREVEVIPNSMISRGSGCYECGRKRAAKKQMKPHEEFVKELPEGIEALEKYRGAHRQIRFKCNKCREEYKTIPRMLVKRGCSRCRGTHRRTIGDVKEEIAELSEGEYEVVSEEYNDPHTHIKVKHKECGNIYPVSRANFRRGKRCPKCASSKGERKVARILDKRGIEYEPQKTFENLEYRSNLYYDFYLGEHKILIEYQGIQHYEPVKYFGGEKRFRVQKEIDKLKREYANKHGYSLVEIPYIESSEEEIEKYLEQNMKFNSVKH